MDAAALDALVDVLARMEIDTRTGHSSFATPLRPAFPGWRQFSTERSNQPTTAAPVAPAVSAAKRATQRTSKRRDPQ